MPVSNRPLLRSIFLSLSAIALLSAGVVLFSACSANTTSALQAPASSENPKAGRDGEPEVAGAQVDKPNQAAAVSPTKTPGVWTTTNLPAPADRVQRSKGGNITVQVTWEGGQGGSDALPFAVAMDTHSVNLDPYDLAKLAILRNDKGWQVAPIAWDAPPGGHHRSGKLVFPAAVDGIPLIEMDTKYVEIVIRDVAGVKERVLRWNLEAKS